MKPALLLVAVAFGVLLVLPSTFGAPCECSSKKELPARNCGEDDVTFYKRVFTVESSSECSVTKFYNSVFTQYSNEDKNAYVKRIDVIFGSVYKNLDCRVNIKRQDFLQKYYEYKFAKKSDENDEEYFERVLPRRDESEETYTCKCELLKKFVKKIDWSKVKIEVKSKRGFSVISKIKAKSCGDKEEKKKRKEEKKQKKEEKKQKKEEKKQSKKSEGSCGSKKKSNSCEDKKRAERAENEKKIKQREEEHQKNVKKIKEREEEHEKNVKKVEKQKKEHAENEKKIKEREEEHKRNEEKIKQREKEHEENVKKVEEQKRQHAENERKIKQREEEHERNKKKVEEREKTHNENVQKIESRKKERKENVRKWIKANYRRKSNEDDSSYFKRICTKTVSTDEEYIEYITEVRSIFTDLDVWYNEKYLSETRQYYSLLYAKKSTETEVQYYQRLVTKESFESDLNCARRIYILHIVFPSLPLWYEDQYYSYVKSFYETYYRKEQSESDELYLQRVFTKCTGESEENFWKRVKLVQKTFSDYQCWYNKEYLQKLDACKCVSGVSSEAELKKRVESEKNSEESEGARKAKLACLQVFFKSSKKSSKKVQTTEESQEEEVSYGSSSKCN